MKRSAAAAPPSSPRASKRQQKSNNIDMSPALSLRDAVYSFLASAGGELPLQELHCDGQAAELGTNNFNCDIAAALEALMVAGNVSAIEKALRADFTIEALGPKRLSDVSAGGGSGMGFQVFVNGKNVFECGCGGGGGYDSGDNDPSRGGDIGASVHLSGRREARISGSHHLGPEGLLVECSDESDIGKYLESVRELKRLLASVDKSRIRVTAGGGGGGGRSELGRLRSQGEETDGGGWGFGFVFESDTGRRYPKRELQPPKRLMISSTAVKSYDTPAWVLQLPEHLRKKSWVGLRNHA